MGSLYLKNSAVELSCRGDVELYGFFELICQLKFNLVEFVKYIIFIFKNEAVPA